MTFRLALAIIEDDSLVTFCGILKRVAEALSAGSTARHCWIFLLRNSTGLLVDLHLVQINRQLAIALIVKHLISIVVILGLAAVVVIVAVRVAVVVVDAALR